MFAMNQQSAGQLDTLAAAADTTSDSLHSLAQRLDEWASSIRGRTLLNEMLGKGVPEHQAEAHAKALAGQLSVAARAVLTAAQEVDAITANASIILDATRSDTLKTGV